MKEDITTLGYKNITLFILLGGESFCGLRQTDGQMDGERQRQTAILTHNYFFSWPYHTVLSSRPHLALLLLLGRGLLNWSPAVDRWLSGVASHLLAHLWLTVSLLAASWDWRKTETPHISHEHLHISFYNTHTFLFNHVTASAYFHRCILFRESLMDGSVKGQYAIKLLAVQTITVFF